MPGRMRNRLFPLAMIALSACTGLSLGENGAGQDTHVDPDEPDEGEHVMGAIAIERDEDRLWVVHEERRGASRIGHLTAIDPDSGAATEVMDVSGTEDRRVLFPADDRMLLLAQQDGQEHMVLFDTDELEPIASRLAPTWYWGTRTSPSGRFLAVADNAADDAPIHIIDLATLEAHLLPQDTDALEAMWNQDQDVLLTVGVTDPFQASATTRIRRYDLSGADLAVGLPEADLDVSLPGIDWDLAFSFTWITTSPDGRWAVFPMRDDGQYRLYILDQETGELRSASGHGPVGFTPDSATIVSYDYEATGEGEEIENQTLLRLLDPVTLEARDVRIDIGLPSFTISHERNEVLVTSALAVDDPVLHYRVDQKKLTAVQGAEAIVLHDFVIPPGRDELWLNSSGGLFRVDLAADRIEEHELPFGLSSVNLRAGAGELALGERAPRVWRFDMDASELAGDATALPSPFDAGARHALPGPRRRSVAGARTAQSPFDPAFQDAR